MGFFDRFRAQPARTDATLPPSPPSPLAPDTAPSAQPAAPASPATSGGVKPLLLAAREKLEARDLPAALALYEQVLAEAGDRADVLVTISGDLGVNGYLREIIDLVAPRYDAHRHGPATGVNLVQAYLALREPDAAQHVLDLLFALNRPELEDRLHGFSNAIAELLLSRQSPLAGAPPAPPSSPADDASAAETADETETPSPAEPAKIDLVTLSKPIWFYGLEALAPRILPPKEGRLRRIAFAQLAALPAAGENDAPADVARLARAVPTWLAETFYFSPHYAPIAIVGTLNDPSRGRRLAEFPAEWSSDNLRQLIDTHSEPLDYVVTGAVRAVAGDYELSLRVWEVKKFRERKQFVARWTPATADAELAQLHETIRAFMEWSADTRALAYTPPPAAQPWLELHDASLAAFLADKGLLARDNIPATDAPAANRAPLVAAATPLASLAWLTLTARENRLGVPVPRVPLSPDPLVTDAAAALGL
ncbi:hypothetical protein K0B96_00205 [Horticoccus luteus]|uniref:Tetratricopeptide repeat protein n=1 Tax=Horticoccus luteus TaxID=2862869 RepID=A0A8F9XGD6_9BACT|nr:hypothetical protein [Horticoccus luteus]QYM79072.1 hypothetical protein K0B96_00205 [Horticoccus luteus]